MSPEEQVKTLALQAGFSLCGIASLSRAPQSLASLEDWLAQGFHAGMAWMERQKDKRLDPRLVLPGCQSLICLGLRHDPGRMDEGGLRGKARVARYARGEDYHCVLGRKLAWLQAGLTAAFPAPAQFRGYADTGPVAEKAWAAAAGLGWQGKNSCLINEQSGSWMLLAVVLCTLELKPDAPAVDRCGSCQLCLQACPTQALVAPGVLDARRCVSYLTIEHRGELAPELAKGVGLNVFGCDICQQVCPWNRKALPAGDAALKARPELEEPDLSSWLAMDEQAFSARFKDTAIKRAKLEGLRRNARMVAGNLRKEEHAPGI
jgi:epoxyqueuosine reductase